ncbi:MAG: histidinol-phosphate transaminase [Candidatus Vogelbacteria bacterium]|nr:histidinol-phosphate transaminase [Candidatus Vogelbacteria bacterium]
MRKGDLFNLGKTTARRLDVLPENLVFFNGTYHALDVLFNFLVHDGETIILPVPTFAFYPKFEKYRRINFKKIKYRENLQLPVTKILAALDVKTKLIYIVNPNNPLGSTATNNELEIVIKAARTKGAYVIVDEVYSEFWGESCIPLIKKYKNLIVLRSFSKIGLSGLKLGLSVSNEKLAQKIEDMRGDTYNVNKASILIVDKIFSRPEQIAKYVEDIKVAKDDLVKFLKNRQVIVLPSATNFVTAKFYCHQELIEQLKQKGILVRDLSHCPDTTRWLKGYLRITVPQGRDLPVLLKTLGQIMDKFKKASS